MNLFLFLMLFTMNRNFHPVTINTFATCGLTHVMITSRAVDVRHEKDGDWVWDFVEGTKLVHLEIIPEFPIKHPTTGDCITVSGVRRFDDEDAPGHQRWEVHPVLKILPATCPVGN